MKVFLIQNIHICASQAPYGILWAPRDIHVTSHFGYLVLLITRTFLSGPVRFEITSVDCRAREIVGFAGSGPIFETEDRFISRQEAKKSVHKTLYFSRFCHIQTDIVTCQNCSHLIIRCYLS